MTSLPSLAPRWHPRLHDGEVLVDRRITGSDRENSGSASAGGWAMRKGPGRLDYPWHPSSPSRSRRRPWASRGAGWLGRLQPADEGDASSPRAPDRVDARSQRRLAEPERFRDRRIGPRPTQCQGRSRLQWLQRHPAAGTTELDVRGSLTGTKERAEDNGHYIGHDEPNLASEREATDAGQVTVGDGRDRSARKRWRRLA